MTARIHGPLKLRMPLRLEELERRAAPAVVLTDGMSFQYNAADGDLDEATFYGPGSVTLANSDGNDPGTPGNANLWYVDLVGTTSKSQLFIRDVVAGDGSDNLICHYFWDFGAEAMGVIDLSAPQQVRFLNIDLTCPLQSVNIHSALYNSGVTTTGPVKSITIEHYAEICSFDIGGNLGTFSTGGGMLQGYINVAGHLGSARITGGDIVGTRVNVGSGCDRFDIYGNTWSAAFTGTPAEFTFYSGVQTFAVYGDMVGTVFQSLGGNVGSFYVQGDVRNSPVGFFGPIATSIDLSNGKCGRIAIGGDLLLDNSGGPSSTAITCTGMRAGKIEIAGSVIGGADITPIIRGSCGLLTIGGDLLGDAPNTDRATIMAIYGKLGTLLIGGDANYAEIDCGCCNQSLIGIEGGINETNVSLTCGAGGSVRITGDVTNSSIDTIYHALRRFWIGGDLDMGSALTARFGALGQTTVAGDVLGGSQIYFEGVAANSLTIGGGLDNGSSVQTDAGVSLRNLRIGGALDRGSTLAVVMSDIDYVRIGGGVFDGATVATTSSSCGDLFIGGPIDSHGGAQPVVTLAGSVGGNLTVGGHVFEGQIAVAFAALLPGSRARILGDFTDSQFTVTTASPLAALEILGNVSGSTFDFINGGVDRISIDGNVSTSTFTVIGPCGPTIIGGFIDTVNWSVASAHAFFRTGGPANQFTYSATGSVGSFHVGGPATDSDFTFTVGGDLVMICGSATGSSVLWGSPMDRLLILGDVNTVVLAGFGGIDFFRAMGNATGLTTNIFGQTGMFLITGALDAGAINLDGMTDVFRVDGAVTNTGLTFSEHVGQIRLGSMSNSQINITNTFPPPGPGSGGADRIVVAGDVDASSTIVVYGPCGLASVRGDVLNSTFTFNNGLGQLDISGRMQDAGITVVGGGLGVSPSDVTAARILDGMWGASALLLDGGCSLLRIGQGVNDTSTVDITGCASFVAIGGDIGAGAVVTIGTTAINGWGYTYYTGTLQRMLVRGLIFGAIDVYGTLHTVDSAGGPGIPNGGSHPPFTQGFETTNRFDNPIGGQVNYMVLAPGGHVS